MILGDLIKLGNKLAMEILYGLSFTIKMSKMSGTQPDGYFEYVVPLLSNSMLR